ncbi:MAG: DUF5644 domain-containing protein [Helicobacteraceae bacterium]|jgi:hypothetical protein|nr:DUF5644 domain-containing protein [Helicobacteraceae bacterium]
MKIEAKIFRFNAEHDYLSSYRPFIFNASGESTLLDLLQAYKRSDPLCAMRIERIEGVRANGLGAPLTAPLAAFAPKGGEIVVEPLIIERAVLDLECDKQDFEDKLSVLEEFCDKSDRDYYNEFYIAYAVSPMRALNSEYLGEALFMLADRLIGKSPPNIEIIAKRISQKDNGVFCFAGLNGALLKGAEHITKTIERLWGMLLSLGLAPKGISEAKYAPLDANDLPRLEGKRAAIAADCGAFAAAPKIDDYENALTIGGAKALRLKNPWRFGGASLKDVLPHIAVKAAGELVLEAQNIGAQTLLCLSKETREFLARNIKTIERESGYPIDIEIATIGA